MIRSVLLIIGFSLLIVQQYIHAVTPQMQLIIFLIGIIMLGVPHGAADLLIAAQNAKNGNVLFSKFKFFFNYLGRLVLFAAFLTFFPFAGSLLFILFAAYHFGETDLHQFKTNTIAGKLFVFSYGLVILAVILLCHYEEVKPLLSLFSPGTEDTFFLNMVELHKYTILYLSVILFFASTFFYFSVAAAYIGNQDRFLVQFVLIVLILYNLPLVLGFTFYFIFWHSLLSLQNIIGYLRKDNLLPAGFITKQISIYSLIATAGIILFGLTGFMFTTNNAMIIYVFPGLAVLTAPHMQIMHDMYNTMRSNREITEQE
jgi:beta-carotene 15,15'-dioxygenase